MKTTLTLLAATAAIALPAAVSAQGHPHRGMQGDMTLDQVRTQSAERFSRLDTDGNGLVTRAEMDAMKAQRAEQRAERMAQMSAERRERIENRMERRQARAGERGERGAKRWERMDANGDGAISLAEFQARPLAMFQRADADGNGIVTQAERQAAREAHRAERRQRRAR